MSWPGGPGHWSDWLEDVGRHIEVSLWVACQIVSKIEDIVQGPGPVGVLSHSSNRPTTNFECKDATFVLPVFLPSSVQLLVRRCMKIDHDLSAYCLCNSYTPLHCPAAWHTTFHEHPRWRMVARDFNYIFLWNTGVGMCGIKKYPTMIYRLKKYRDTGIPRYFVASSIVDNFCKNPTVRITYSALTDSICDLC